VAVEVVTGVDDAHSRFWNDNVSIKPFDVVVALKAHLWAANVPWSFERLGTSVGVSASQAHAATRRLAEAGLYRPADRSVRVHALTAFAAHGIPHVLPVPPGPLVVGMPTPHAAPPLCHELSYSEAYVWPASEGVPGRAIVPLHPALPAAGTQDPQLYAALALIDALRVGRVRDRQLAMSALDRLLGEPARDASWVRARELARDAG